MLKTDLEYFCDLTGKFNKGEINIEIYSKERGISKRDKLPELYEFRQIIIGYPDMLNLFLGQTSIGIRCMVMKAIFELNDRQLAGIIGCSKSTISDFINGNLTINSDPNVNPSRNFSANMICKLSIICDLPYRYLSDSQAEYNLVNSFHEYERVTIEKISLIKLVERTIEDTMRNSQSNRMIFGVRLENVFFPNGNYLNARVDIRQSFFTVEIHFKDDTIISRQVINKIESSIKRKSKIYYRNTFMRNNNKLYILISVDDSYFPVLPYLNDNLLIDNLMFCDDWRIENIDESAKRNFKL